MSSRPHALSGFVEYRARDRCELGSHAPGECRGDWRTVYRVRDRYSGLGEFDIVYCPRCRLGFTEPYPSEETVWALYDTRDTADFDPVRGSVIDRVKDGLSRRAVARLAPHDHVDAVLDYGTGNGRFASAAARTFTGARVDAVDHQPVPPPLLRGADSPVRYLDLSAFSAEDDRYDLVIVRHVLEHTHHPVELLRSLSARLKPDGSLYVEVPNLDSGCARVFGSWWKAHYVPRHIFHFTRASLADTIARAGLTGSVAGNDMPMMGNMVALLTGLDETAVAVQSLGILLHPLQRAIELVCGSSTCIHARCVRAAAEATPPPAGTTAR